MPRPRSYIVRIYARQSIVRVEGIVEIVASGVLVPFGTADELWAIVGRGRTTPRSVSIRGASHPTGKVRR